MEIISVIGMVLGVAVLIYLTFKGVNGFVASLVGSIIVIVSSGLPFWGTLTGTYAASLGSTFGSYLFLFTIGSAYSELMKKSGAAESIANFLFAFLGVKATVAGTLIITFLLAYGGVNAFIIIFAVYPVAVPMFRKANVSKLLMPAIFLYGAVVLNVVTPGAPSMLCIALSEKLGVTTFAAPTMAIVLLVVAFGFGIFYFTWASNSLRARGIGFVASESDAELIAGKLFVFRGGLFGRHGDKLRDVRILIEPREEAREVDHNAVHVIRKRDLVRLGRLVSALFLGDL